MESIYANSNKYGFELNINHPYINKLYVRFKTSKGIGINYPLSDDLRREFEKAVILNLRKKGLLPTKGVADNG